MSVPHTVVQDCNDLVDRSAIPIYRAEKRGTPSLIGSALMLQINDATFFCTAAHVYLAARGRQICIPDHDVLRPFRPGGTAFQCAESPRRNDLYDLAVERIDSVVLDRLAWYRPVPVSMLEPNELPDTDDVYDFLGYPASKNKSRRGTDLVRATLARYISTPLPQLWYDHYGFRANFHLLAFFGTSITTPDGRILRPANPRGMSGGPIWRRQPRRSKADSSSALVAIALEQRRNALIGLRVSFILQAIRFLHPELSPFMPDCPWVAPRFETAPIKSCT
jgi:hypothetical protein